MSIVTYEKPSPHVSLADWQAQLWELRQTAATRHADGYQLRNEAQQLRNETNSQTRWSAYHNDARLRDRVQEVTDWRDTLTLCLRKVREEIENIAKEKSLTDNALEFNITVPLDVVGECMRTRDSRRGNDLNQDEAYMELRNELAVIEALKVMLADKVHAAWEMTNRLREQEAKLELDLENKQTALDLDTLNLEMTESCSGTSYKPDPLRVPRNCVPYDVWNSRSRCNKLRADNEILASMKLREAMYCARERAYNDLKAQHDATNMAIRRRLYETRRIQVELAWQREKMVAEMKKLEKELECLEHSLADKTDKLKLAETRLENRLYRPGAELVHDEPQIGIGEQVLELRNTRALLSRKIAAARATYNAMEHHLVRVDDDLNNKGGALAVDQKCSDARSRLSTVARKQTQTDVNIRLTRMEDEIPKY